ncbi:hypothetical protein SDC9_47082 [bioreactor metagenome]|uniref:DUF2158 domain-containing protein n=1 Tax=bioreactor metagenome TaxID=1076179 RepID=A0A644WB85_9ZZZZ
MEQEIEVGDVVCLKSDATRRFHFSVGYIKDKMASCWYVIGGEPKNELIPVGALQIVTKNK